MEGVGPRISFPKYVSGKTLGYASILDNNFSILSRSTKSYFHIQMPVTQMQQRRLNPVKVTQTTSTKDILYLLVL